MAAGGAAARLAYHGRADPVIRPSPNRLRSPGAASEPTTFSLEIHCGGHLIRKIERHGNGREERVHTEKRRNGDERSGMR